MLELTKRQSQILSLVASFTQANGYAPTYRDLMPLCGITSTATLHKHVQNLKALGHLQSGQKITLAKPPKPILTKQHEARQVAIIGSVARGQKIELFAETSHIDLPLTLSSSKHNVYGFCVRDASFAPLAMQRGDLLIVESRNVANDGEMVLAVSKKQGTEIARAPLSPDFAIQGIICCLLRKYSA